MRDNLLQILYIFLRNLTSKWFEHNFLMTATLSYKLSFFFGYNINIKIGAFHIILQIQMVCIYS